MFGLSGKWAVIPPCCRMESAWLVVLLAPLVIYGSRLGALTLRGEETRRACVAREMLSTGDWVVPRQQGTVFADRPPLQNWVVALTMLVVGENNPLAVRLPSVAAITLLTLLVYGYSRLFLGRFGALTSALAFATFGQELELGRLGETEALFALFVSSSLLVWHWGYSRGWPAWRYWVAGYALAALAALTKGPQGPIYFIAGCGGYLAWRRNLHSMLTWSHAIGLAAGSAIVLAWHIPFSQAVPTPLVLKTWGYLAAARYNYADPWKIVRHATSFPLEVFGCLAPWSVLLLAYLAPSVRRSLGAASDAASFLAVASGLAFVTCWIAPDARGRYFMPMHALFGPLIGLAAERLRCAAAGRSAQRFWQAVQRGVAGLMLAAGLGVLAASCWPDVLKTGIAQPLGFAAIYTVASAALAWLTWRAGSLAAANRPAVEACALAAFLGLTFTGVVVNVRQSRSEDLAGAVAALKRRLPPDARLVSLGIAHHAFAYYYRDFIPLAESSGTEGDSGDWDFFCYHAPADGPAPRVDFPWETVAVISCDRNRQPTPREKTIVGRRLPRLASKIEK